MLSQSRKHQRTAHRGNRALKSNRVKDDLEPLVDNTKEIVPRQLSIVPDDLSSGRKVSAFLERLMPTNRGEAAAAVLVPWVPDPTKHFRLYAEITEEKPRIVCSPDLAFLLRVGDHKAAFLVEVETGKNGPRWAAHRKYRGYYEFSQRGLQRRYFPTVTLDHPHVLSIWPTPNFRDAFVRQLRGKDGADLWRAAAQTELTAETFLFGKIWHRLGGDPVPLVKT